MLGNHIRVEQVPTRLIIGVAESVGVGHALAESSACFVDRIAPEGVRGRSEVGFAELPPTGMGVRTEPPGKTNAIGSRRCTEDARQRRPAPEGFGDRVVVVSLFESSESAHGSVE